MSLRFFSDQCVPQEMVEALRQAGLRHSNFGLRISEFGFPPQAVLSPAALRWDRLELARPAEACRQRRKRSTVRRGNLPFRDPSNACRRFIPLLQAAAGPAKPVRKQL